MSKPSRTAVGCFTVSRWYLCESRCRRARVIEIHDVGEDSFVFSCPNCGIACSDLDLQEAISLISDDKTHLLMLPGPAAVIQGTPSLAYGDGQ